MSKLVLLVVMLVELVLSDECYWNRRCPYQLFASKTPYDTVRGDIRDYPAIDGCEAVSVWVLSRHGNRNPGGSTTDAMKVVAGLKDAIISSYNMGTSRLCAQDIQDLKEWSWNATIEEATSHLTGTGYEELYNLGRRLREKYPHLLATEDSSKFYFRPTAEQRTITSAIAFVHGLTDGTRLNLTIDEARPGDTIIRTYDECARYRAEVRSANSTVVEQIDDYQESAAYTAVQNAVQNRLGIQYQLKKEDVYAFYEVCRFYRSWSKDLRSPWCSVFSQEDLVVLEYRDDIRHYYRNGYGHWINPRLGGPPLKDLYDNFVASMVDGRGKNIVSYFTHDTMVQMVFAALDLYKDNNTLESTYIDPNRLWRTSGIAAFSTNLIAVLNRCNFNNPEYRVQFFISEKETPICPVSGCSWDEFTEKFRKFTEYNLDVCDMNYEVSSTTTMPLGSDARDAAFTHSALLSLVLLSQVYILWPLF